MPAFYCGRHARRGDLPIPAAGGVLRVRVQLGADFAATVWQPAAAELEVVSCLEDAIRAAGGLPHVYSVTSVIGRFGPQAAKATLPVRPPVG